MQAHCHQRVAGRLPSRHSSALLCHARLNQGQSRRSRQNRRQLLVLSSSVVAPSFAIQSVDSAAAEELSAAPRRDVEQHSDSIVDSIQNPPTFVKATGRIVAIGDLHGDWSKAIECLRAANVIKITPDEEIIWCGGDTVLVQLGDVLDRGDHEIAIVSLLRGLDHQARQEGGAVYMLNGNHESLNICGDFRYVTPGAFIESAKFAGIKDEDTRDWELLARVRYAVYRPGGPMAMELSRNPTVLVVNDTVFAHGGLLPAHVNYGLERMNNEVAAWMRADSTGEGGKSAPPFLAMGDNNSVMWNRTLSKERFTTPYDRFNACNALRQALDNINAKRLVVGHTPQLSGANCECDGCVWRIDVGMSYGVLNRPVQVLEIIPNGQTEAPAVRVLPEYGAGSSLDDDLTSIEV